MKYSEVKMIVSDLDGTLVNSKKIVTSYTKKVLHSIISQGSILVLASGRPLFGIKNVIDELKLKQLGGYVISYNGCLVTDIKSNYVIYEKKLPDNILIPIYEFVKNLGNVKIATYKPGYIYSENEDDEYLAVEAFGCGTPVTVVKYLPDIMKNGIYKFVVTGNPTVIPEARKLVDDRFGNEIDTIISEPFFLEIVPKGVNKAIALNKLAKYLGLKNIQIAAFGDAQNDIEMLEYVGVSFAMKNGCEKIKNIASHITDSNDEDGVAAAIEKYFLE